jgi:hypothetical protein
METKLKNISIRMHIILNPKLKTGQLGQSGQSQIILSLGQHTNTLQKLIHTAVTGAK